MIDLQTALTDRDILIKRVVDLQAECARLKSDNASHAGVNLLVARQNADLRNVLSDLREAGVIPGAMRGRVSDVLDLYAKPHAWYREYRAGVEAAHAASLSRIEVLAVEWITTQGPAIDAALERSQAACGSEVARG